MKENKVISLGNGGERRVTKDMVAQISRKAVNDSNALGMVLLVVKEDRSITQTVTEGCYNAIFTTIGGLEFIKADFTDYILKLYGNK